MMLSPHFHAWEFECSCGCGYGTKPGDVSEKLLAALEDLREILDAPIHINSGCRCPDHNRRIGGKRNSQHLRGTAVDIRTDDIPPGQVALAARTIDAFIHGGIGRYDTFVHLDVRGYRARWDMRTKE